MEAAYGARRAGERERFQRRQKSAAGLRSAGARPRKAQGLPCERGEGGRGGSEETALRPAPNQACRAAASRAPCRSRRTDRRWSESKARAACCTSASSTPPTLLV